MNKEKSIHIVGTVGLPASYGGFETLVENLAKFHHQKEIKHSVTVYCDNTKEVEPSYLSFRLKRINFKANGWQSIPYDICSIYRACREGADIILVLGVSGAIAFPIVRTFSSAKIVCNVDGIEWKREKWSRAAKIFLRFSERIAVKFANLTITDNKAVSDHINKCYGRHSEVIEYGGDHAKILSGSKGIETKFSKYFFKVCRIEPENNIHIILEAFSKSPERNIIIVGNWDKSSYGASLKKMYLSCKNINLLDPIYDIEILSHLRANSIGFIHGHSAGGTNPSLVEAMHFGKPVIAYNCEFNRETTEDSAIYFEDTASLISLLKKPICESVGDKMIDIAQRRYRWEIVASRYFDTFKAVMK